MNDENSLRTYGSKTDAYAVFKNMLASDNPPDDWVELLKAASKSMSEARFDKAYRNATRSEI